MAALIIVACGVHVLRHLPALLAPGTLPGAVALLLGGCALGLAAVVAAAVRLSSSLSLATAPATAGTAQRTA